MVFLFQFFDVIGTRILTKQKHFSKLSKTSPLYNILINNKPTYRKEVIIMNKNDQEFLVQKIRTQYTEKEHTALDALRKLDTKVKRPANVFAYIFGSISALIMGSGMSLCMTDIGTTLGITSTMSTGIVIGIVGMLMAIINYPIYKGILGFRKKKYAAEILELSDRLMNNH